MPNPTPLLFLTHNYPRFPGDSSGVFIALLAKRLTDYGIRPIVLAPADARAAAREDADAVTVYRFHYAADLSSENLAYRGNMHRIVLGSVTGPWRFRRFVDRFSETALEIIAKEKISLLAGHWLIPAGLVMKRISRSVSLPMILSSHGTDVRLVRRFSGLVYPYFRRFCRRLRRWTVVSDFLREQILQCDASLNSIVEVLPLPHDETVFYKEDHVKRDDNLTVAVTRFTKQKRVDLLIRAFSMVAAKKPDARLEIYGLGPLQADMENLIGRLGLYGQVSISPPIPQEKLREVYNRAAIVVLNSHQEGFGLALSEGMMCGAAAIGTSSGGITDIIKDGERGLLVPVDDASALAQSILRLLNDPSLRKTLADNGHRYACETYASGPLARRYAQIAQEASSGRSAPI